MWVCRSIHVHLYSNTQRTQSTNNCQHLVQFFQQRAIRRLAALITQYFKIYKCSTLNGISHSTIVFVLYKMFLLSIKLLWFQLFKQLFNISCIFQLILCDFCVFYFHIGKYSVEKNQIDFGHSWWKRFVAAAIMFPIQLFRWKINRLWILIVG